MDPKDPKKNQYLKLIRSDNRITLDDIKLLFEKDLDHASAYWLFAVGAIIGFLTYGLGTLSALGKNALLTTEGSSAFLVVITATVGITVFVYIVNWEKVSRTSFSYYIEARSELEARAKNVQSPSQAKSEGLALTTSTPQAGERSEISPDEKREIEKEKMRLAWDYVKSFEQSKLVIVFSAFVAIATILTTLTINQKITPPSEVGAMLGAFVVILYYMMDIRVGLRSLVIQTDDRMTDLERGNSIGSFKALCQVESKPQSSWQELYRIFPGGKVGVIFVAILAIVLVGWGFTH